MWYNTRLTTSAQTIQTPKLSRPCPSPDGRYGSCPPSSLCSSRLSVAERPWRPALSAWDTVQVGAADRPWGPALSGWDTLQVGVLVWPWRPSLSAWDNVQFHCTLSVADRSLAGVDHGHFWLNDCGRLWIRIQGLMRQAVKFCKMYLSKMSSNFEGKSLLKMTSSYS